MSNSRPLQSRSTVIALSLILSALRAASHATPSSAASIQGCGAHSTLLATALSGIGIEVTVLAFGFLFFGVERMFLPVTGRQPRTAQDCLHYQLRVGDRLRRRAISG